MSVDSAAAAQRIIDTYHATSAETRALGTAWYANAELQAASMVRPGALNATTACGVVAALSPRCGWAQNLTWAARVLAAKRQRKGCPAVHTTAMRAAAWRIAGGENPLDVLNGPKTRAFYRNLCGDYTCVTVDVWAARAALGLPADVQPPALTGGVYDAIAGAYVDAACELGLEPAVLQAIVWCEIRGVAH